MTFGEGRPPRRHFNARMSVRFRWLTTPTISQPNVHVNSGFFRSGGARLGLQKNGLPWSLLVDICRFKSAYGLPLNCGLRGGLAVRAGGACCGSVRGERWRARFRISDITCQSDKFNLQSRQSDLPPFLLLAGLHLSAD
jgi:hypothetical protein